MSDEAADVLPPAVNGSLAAAWILLFGFRWIATPFLLAAGILSPSGVADLDDRVLIRIYLVLLAITVVVTVLRVLRGSSRMTGAASGSRPEQSAGQPRQAG
ncbi:MAG TPA: hypothetical protein VKT77_07190 [Chthonomonadaceae bacterium]|nr:hypothetical protein [Chthonomonadaceae bacterium]